MLSDVTRMYDVVTRHSMDFANRFSVIAKKLKQSIVVHLTDESTLLSLADTGININQTKVPRISLGIDNE